MALFYGGNSDWEPASEPQVSSPPNEPIVVREKWIGRQDEIESFLTSKAVGSSYLSGFIVDNTPQDNTPFAGVATVDLIVLRAPSFSDYLAANTYAAKTLTLSAEVTTSGVIEGETDLRCSLSATYVSPGTRYTYFTSTRPAAARFAAPLTSDSPRVLRSTMSASAGSQTRTFTGVGAPAAIVSALTPATVNIGTEPEAEPIPGTPWFRCTEVWTRELEGD